MKHFATGCVGDECISPVVLRDGNSAVRDAAPSALGWPNYGRSTQVVCCKNLQLFMKVLSLNPLTPFRSQLKTVKEERGTSSACCSAIIAVIY